MTWKWDLTVYDPTTGLYSFQLEDYNDKANSASDPGQEHGESEETHLLHQKSALLKSKVDHFERQQAALIEKQQNLIDALSKGFNGDRQVAANHVMAINQSVKDIQMLEERIEDHKIHMQWNQSRYLELCNKDDRTTINHLEKDIENIKYRLEYLDPELFDPCVEQTSLCTTRTKIDALKQAISNREDELIQLEQHVNPKKGSVSDSSKNVGAKENTPRGEPDTGYASKTTQKKKQQTPIIGGSRNGKKGSRNAGVGQESSAVPDLDETSENESKCRIIWLLISMFISHKWLPRQIERSQSGSRIATTVDSGSRIANWCARTSSSFHQQASYLLIWFLPFSHPRRTSK